MNPNMFMQMLQNPQFLQMLEQRFGQNNPYMPSMDSNNIAGMRKTMGMHPMNNMGYQGGATPGMRFGGEISNRGGMPAGMPKFNPTMIGQAPARGVDFNNTTFRGVLPGEGNGYKLNPMPMPSVPYAPIPNKTGNTGINPITRQGSGAFMGGQRIGHYGNNNELVYDNGSPYAPSSSTKPAMPTMKPTTMSGSNLRSAI